jgi:CRP-like cAMP-binding protein
MPLESKFRTSTGAESRVAAWHAVARTPLFADLPPAALQRLSARAVVRDFAAGSVLWTAGSPIDHVLIVVSGRVRVVRTESGRQSVIHTEGPGGTLGEVPLFSGGTAPATAVAAVRTRCLAISRAAIADLIAADPQIAWLFLAQLGGRVRVLVERIDNLAGRDVTTRVARFLIERAAPGTTALTLGMTQSEFAEELGTVREVLVRALRTLKIRGAIRSIGRGRFAIADARVLRSSAGYGLV